MTTHPSLIHNINSKKTAHDMPLPIILGIILVAIFLGVGTGYGASAMTNGAGKTTTKDSSTADSGSTENSAGVKDEKTYPDKVEGTLAEGGFEGEGSFHLVRPGGESQNVYLTSTTVDLSKFLKKKVRVWGQTFGAAKAGWLMDVGYIEIVK